MLLAEWPLWPETYAEGRRCFLEACSAAGAAVVTHPHPLLGPDGAELATDVALVGDVAARRVLLVCTATHGVEGFTGSACLLQWLRAHADSSGLLPPDTRAVLVHAINPHGYAWVRRVNEDNIDLNRNFIDHDAPRAPNAMYTAAHPFVRPATDSPPDWSAADAGLAAVAEANGVSDAMRTVLGGQYERADGIFYGGTRPAWSNEMIRRIVREHVGDTAERLIFLDLHTGLGPFGHAELMCNGHSAGWAARLREIFGEACTGGEREGSPGPTAGPLATA